MSLSSQETIQFINHRRLLISTVVSLAGYVYLTCYEQRNYFFKRFIFKIITNIYFVRIQYMFDNHVSIG